MRPDLGRALRALFAAIVPLIAASQGWLPLSLPFFVFAAQSVAIVDVRGAYTVRLGLLLSMSVILGGTAWVGGAVATHVTAAILAAALVAAAGGVWRHLTPDYGAALGVSSTLLFLISASTLPAAGTSEHHGLSALAGGFWGVLLQVANWPINPQHPLRRVVSDSWVAIADLFEALGLTEPSIRGDKTRQQETAVRVALDQAYAALANARRTPLRQRLDDLNLAAARIATRVIAFHTALESIRSDARSPWVSESLQPLLTSLTNISRSVAVTVVSRQPGHLTTFEVRLRRLRNLLAVFHSQAPLKLQDPAAAAQLRAILGQLEALLPEVHATLRATIDRADERAAFSLELRDLQTWTLRPLASSLNFNRRMDPALLRFTLRSAVLTMLGVAVFKFAALPHGYWLPLTMAIVLQPDYGSTRTRAAQRVMGTFAGSLAASFFLWLQLPFAALVAAYGATMFGFGFFLKRNYAAAVLFITLAVVLLTEAHEPVTWWFTAERLASTLAGGAAAWLAALFLWPAWERQRIRGVLADALLANRELLLILAERLHQGGAYDEQAIAAKRRAEAANSTVFASLQRMTADPRGHREGLEQLAALANGNQRITRALTLIAVHLSPGHPVQSAAVASFATLAGQKLQALSEGLQRAQPAAEIETWNATLEKLTVPGEAESGDAARQREQWVIAQSLRIATEIAALEIAVGGSAAEETPDQPPAGLS